MEEVLNWKPTKVESRILEDYGFKVYEHENCTEFDYHGDCTIVVDKDDNITVAEMFEKFAENFNEYDWVYNRIEARPDAEIFWKPCPEQLKLMESLLKSAREIHEVLETVSHYMNYTHIPITETYEVNGEKVKFATGGYYTVKRERK